MQVIKMPLFKYEAIKAKGGSMTATIEALTQSDALSKIRNQGYLPTKLIPLTHTTSPSAGMGDASHRKSGVGKVKTKVITEFARELATLQEAGLPLLRSLRSLQKQEKSKSFKKIIGFIADDIEGGATLSEAMNRYPGCFDRLFVGMVAAGEKGGILELILTRLADFMEKSERLKAKVKGAMIYPATVLTVAFAIVLLLMTFVIPKFEAVLNELSEGRELNVITRTVMGIASWIAKDYGWAILVGIPIGFIILTRIARRFQIGRMVLDSIILKLPVIGELRRRISIARWTRTLGTLLGAGVPILDAIAVTTQTTGNEVFSKLLTNVGESIRQGDTFVNPLEKSRQVPSTVVSMLAVGEESGDLDKMLLKLGDKYDYRVDVQVNSLMSLLEPVVIIVLGVIVLFILLAILLPVFSDIIPM